MWLDCLVFCDCDFQSVCPLIEKDKRFMEASWCKRLTEGETGSFSYGWGHAQQIFNHIFCWWVELCSLPAIYVGPNYGGGNEDNGDLLQKIPCMYCYCSRPPLTHASAGNSWTLTGKSGSVSCGLTLLSPGSWCTRFCLCPPRVCFPVLCKFWQLYVEVNDNLLQEGLCHTQVCCAQSPCSCGSPLRTRTSQETLKHSSASVSVGSLGPIEYKVCLSPLSISGRNGVWF